MVSIEVKCRLCKYVHRVDRTKEIPDNISHIECNWCTMCEDRATGYFEEYWMEGDSTRRKPKPSEPDPNQLSLF